jgi:hypothetical protein
MSANNYKEVPAYVARWQEATQDPKVKEMQLLVHEKRKVLQLQSQLRHKQQVSDRLRATSACEQHTDPLS